MTTLTEETERWIYLGFNYRIGYHIVKENEWGEYVKIMNDIKMLVGYYP